MMSSHVKLTGPARKCMLIALADRYVKRGAELGRRSKFSELEIWYRSPRYSYADLEAQLNLIITMWEREVQIATTAKRIKEIRLETRKIQAEIKRLTEAYGAAGDPMTTGL